MDEQESQVLKHSGLLRYARNDGHCEEQSDEAIQKATISKWEVFMHGINSFSDDFMSEGRQQGELQERENW
jgi:hypothetical protein